MRPGPFAKHIRAHRDRDLDIARVSLSKFVAIAKVKQRSTDAHQELTTGFDG